MLHDRSLPMWSIYQDNGAPYVSVIDEGMTFALQLHRYGRVVVVLDKKVLPELIDILKHLQDNEQKAA